jgi:hypothetical protein
MCKKWILAALIAILVASVHLEESSAAKGRPGSGEFAYGAHLAIEGVLIEPALNAARNLPLDWIAINFNWSKYAQNAEAEPDWRVLDPIMAFAARENISIMLSIQSAPAWAMTAQGPDPQQTGQLVAALTQRYPGALAALELFPAPNTSKGWGAVPDPHAYLQVLSQVRTQLQAPVLLVAGAIRPIAAHPTANDWDDLTYLQHLYDAGLTSVTDIIGLQLCEMTGDPLFVDGQENRVLRHYEQVRQVMVNNHHHSAVIWVTRLCPPSGTINTADQRYQDPQSQVDWLTQAYGLLRGQLYIGAAFYASLNPDLAGSNQTWAIVIDSNQYHRFYLKLRELVAENSPEAALSRRGRSKEGELVKRRS